MGSDLRDYDWDNPESPIFAATQANPWFTDTSIRESMKAISKMIEVEKLQEWTGKYAYTNHPKTVGVIMAGNIPAVGFHDLLSVLVSGHRIRIKLSSKDPVLIRFLIEKLISLRPELQDRIEIVEQLKDFDAVIATGSDNSSNYFRQYFSRYPHIIRQNRVSCAILGDNESPDDFDALGQDILSYYGLGCRNVSKIFIPEGYALEGLLEALAKQDSVMDHHKYANNYDYNKSIYLVNKEAHLDTGFLLLRESMEMVSPISVVYYQYYSNTDELSAYLEANEEKIQCIVSTMDWPGSVKPGHAQCPEPWDYADNIDTLKFLSEL